MQIPNETDVVAQLAEADGKIKNLQAENSAQAATIKKLTDDATAAVALQTELEAKLQAAQKDNTALKASQTDFNGKVAAAIAQHGVTHPQVAQNNTQKMTQEEAFKQYDSINDPYEQGRFWDQHKQLLTGKE